MHLHPVAILGVLALAHASAHAAPRTQGVAPAQGARPRVVLVLSGGGARGAAHIGVLEVLEDLRVPVDAVVGTSMGAIVGGLYATGYSPQDLARIIADADWPTLLSDAPPRDELWFRRRQDARRFQVDLEFGWKNKTPVLPPGLILGRNVEMFLERLTLPVSGLQSFDDLHLDFRCVATDLGDGSAKVFERGNLARAIRASMSLPGFFAPVVIDGRVYVDGGVVDNVPVDVARALGADVVIAVDISTPLGDVEKLRSALGVSDQVIGILMAQSRQNSLDLLGQADVAITPELGTLSTMAFERAYEAIDIGREAALGARAALEALSVDEPTWQAWVARQRQAQWQPPTVRHLTLRRETRLSEKILRRFSAVREGRPLDAATLERTRQDLAGLDIFEGIEVDVQPVEGSPDEVDVELRAVEKSWGNDYLRFGLGLSSDLQGEGEFGVGVQHTATPLNSKAGEWRNEATLGSRTRLYSEFYQPFDRGLRWFVAPSVLYEQDNVDLNIAGQPVAEVGVQSAEASLDLGRNLGSWGEIRAGYGYKSARASPSIGLPGLLPESAQVEGGALSVELNLDTLDSLTFPRHGAIGGLEWRVEESPFEGDDQKSLLEGGLALPATRGALTVLTSVEGGVTFEGELPFGAEFQLGGFRRLSGLAPNSISGNHYALAVLQPYWQLSQRSSLFGIARYVGMTLEYGGVWQDLAGLQADDMNVGASVYLGFDTLLGSAFLGFGTSEGGHTSAYVFIGPVL
jgi:NTE family protein